MGFDYTYESYKEKVPFPSKSDFTVIYGYSAGKVVFEVSPKELTSELQNKAATTETVLDKEAFNAAMSAYRAETSRVYKQFHDDLLEEYDVTEHPKAELCFDKAWERGHSNGFESVFNAFDDLVELIQ